MPDDSDAATRAAAGAFFHDLFSLDGKVALVTGASGGIGRALAVALARAGAAVALHGTREDALAAAREEIAAFGGRAALLPADLTEPEACRALPAAAAGALGGLDILVNCAGINRRKPLRDVTLDDFETIVGVNLRAVYLLCQAAYPLLKARGGGKVLNIGSVTSTTGVAGVSVYGSTKAAIWQLTRTLALEWAPDNIQVNCLAPGFMMTPLTEQGLWRDPHRREWLLDRIAARRPGRPEELIGAALLLVSPAGSYLTGAFLNVDGGFLAGGSWLRDDE